MEGAKTVDQALIVLMALEPQARTVSEVSEMTGLNRTVVHRMLASLHERGFVRREGDLYSPGAVFVRFAAKVEPALRTVARPVMRDLSAATEETVVLSVPDHLDAVAVEQVPGREHPLRVEYEPGSRGPITKGASGRAILAFHDEELLARALRTVSHPEEQAAVLAEVRAAGYALSRDELRNGVHGIAAPVWAKGEAIASLSVIVPAQRGEVLLGHLDALLQATAAITTGLDGTIDMGSSSDDTRSAEPTGTD